MKIISGDNYFILGVQSLIEKLNISKNSRKVVFDSGSQYVYIFNSDKLKLAELTDSLSALIQCRRFYLSRDSTLEIYCEHLKEKRTEDLLDVNQPHLTVREEMVIKELCKVSNPKNIAYRLNICEKTVSGYKISGLRKLGVKNTVTLHSVLQSWNEVLSTICPDSRVRNK